MEPTATDEKKIAAKISRDSDYRIAALTCAVNRAGQDGGLEGTVDVLTLAELYFGWLKGQQEGASEKPTLEAMLEGEQKEEE